MTWIERLMVATREAESPRQYFYWAGLTAISATVKNQVYIDRFYYKLYPNIYVLLIGRSGLRKGVPVSICSSLVKAVNNTRVFEGRVSVQKIIEDLSLGYTQEDGTLISDSVGFLKSSEFASFIVEDASALTILTDLYDGHYSSDWEYRTKKSGKQALKNVCLTMIGASNEVHFRDAVPQNAIGGGFIARTFIVFADKKARINPLTVAPEQLVNIPQLTEHLTAISKLRGAFEWTKEARELYELWYQELSKAEYVDDTGTIERMSDSILKVAMLLSLSRSTDLMLTGDDMRGAILAAEELTSGVKKVTLGPGKAPLAPQTRLVVMALIEAPDYKLTRQKLLQRYWGQFDAMDLDRIQENLVQSGLAKVSPPEKGQVWISLNPKYIEALVGQKEESEKKKR